MNLRKRIFWFLDQLKGNPLKKVLKSTESILESKDDLWVKKESEKQLELLIKHTTSTVKFYQEKEYRILSDFPVLNKNIIRDHYDDFFSNKFNKEDCKLIYTSGSTGVPFRLYQNKEKVQKINADNIYFSSKSNYHVGEPLVVIRAWLQEIDFKVKLDCFKKNIIPFSTFDLVDDGIPKVIKQLNSKYKNKTLSFMTYGSTLDNICKYLDTLETNPISFKTKSIVTISDGLSKYAKETALKYFDVVPLSRYSNTESGIIAQQIEANDHRFRINNSSFIIEILDLDMDTQVPYGEPGRIVITDLHNFATPLIRYDTGDVGVMELDQDILYFSEISGRKLDQLYTTEGKLLPSLYMTTKIKDFGEFKQFQIIQKSKNEYHINLNTATTFDTSEIIKEYKKHFGNNALVKVNFVNDIPLLSSGKRRQVVNEFYK